MKLNFSTILIGLTFGFALDGYCASPSTCHSRCAVLERRGRIASDTKSSVRKPKIYDLSILNLKSTTTLENSLMTTNSAISITQADFNSISAAGKSWLDFLSIENKSFSMNIGTANASTPQTWVLPTNFMSNFDGVGRSDFILPSSLPAGLQIGGADRVMKDYYLDEDENELVIYQHFDIGANSIEHIGTSYDLEFGNDQNFDEPNYEFADVPLELGDSWTITKDEEDYISGLNLNRVVQSININGYGTITTPDGVFNCLRISYMTQVYSRPNETSGFTLSSTTNGIGFATKEGYFFYGEVNALSGPATITNFYFRKVVQTNTLTEFEDVRLNNDSRGVTINTDNTLAHPSSILEISSNNKGVLIPRISKANRPTSPAEGLLIYQIDETPGFYFYNGSAWRILSSAASARVATQEQTNAGFRGKSQLISGSVFVGFDTPRDDFEDLVIQIQPEGDCNGLFIAEKNRDGFVVKELQKGKSNVRFTWSIN
ncbi:MAG: hypothetical protein MUF45_04870 [Spirosomaceae bacterium]|nr:hypothetical protein [Spirosomataceae bacterium]